MGKQVARFEARYSRGKEAVIFQTEAPEWEARLACQLIERWGMVMAKPDGEDSAGRQKLAPLSPREIVEHACDVASLAVAEFRLRGWVTEVPVPDPEPEG